MFQVERFGAADVASARIVASTEQFDPSSNASLNSGACPRDTTLSHPWQST